MPHFKSFEEFILFMEDYEINPINKSPTISFTSAYC
jgi:hypothetical protein